MRTRLSTSLLALLLVATACGSGSDDVDTGGSSSSATTIVVGSSSSTTSVPTSTTTTESVPSADPLFDPVDEAELPGDDFDIGPPAGTEVGVISVRFDDTLNVRLMPGTDQPVVAELDPTEMGVLMTGRKRLLPRSAWWELDLGADGIGWANSRYLAPFAATRDDTAWLVEQLDGDIPEAADLDALAALIADVYANFDDPTPSIVTVVEGSMGDLGEITIDVTQYPDDAVTGDRLVIFATAEGGVVGLKSIEATALCRRGLTEDGELCV
jgi:hypothetical protein